MWFSSLALSRANTTTSLYIWGLLTFSLSFSPCFSLPPAWLSLSAHTSGRRDVPQLYRNNATRQQPCILYDRDMITVAICGLLLTLHLMNSRCLNANVHESSFTLQLHIWFPFFSPNFTIYVTIWGVWVFALGKVGKKDKCCAHLLKKHHQGYIPSAAPVDLLGVIQEDCRCTGELPGVAACVCECEWIERLSMAL